MGILALFVCRKDLQRKVRHQEKAGKYPSELETEESVG